jgi:hypothetical protein
MPLRQDRPGADGGIHRQWTRGARVAWAAIVLIAAVAVIGFGVTSRRHVDRVTAPKPVLGSALTPISLHVIVYGRSIHPGPGEIAVPESDRPGHLAILQRATVSQLDVEYARVRPEGGQHWFLTVVAREPGGAAAFSTTAVLGGVVDGREYRAGVLGGTLDATNFEIFSNSAYGMTEREAVALARTVTTSVTVADCSTSEIASNGCT